MTLGTMITARSCAKYAGGHLIAWSSNVKSMDVAKQDEFCLFWVWFPGTFAVVLHEQWHRSGTGVGC